MKKTTSTILLLGFFAGIVSAQTDSLTTAPSLEVFTDEAKLLPAPKVTIDFDVRAAFTTGEFKDFYSKAGMGGFGGTVLFPIGKKNPLDVGFGLGYYFMNNSQVTHELYTPGVGDYDINSKVSGSMVPFHLTARLYPLKSTRSPIQPYIEGLAGFRLFLVEHELSTYIYSIDTELPPETNTNTTGSWSYGFGGGVKIRMSRNQLLYLNLKVAQLYGTETKNMDPSSLVLYNDGAYGYNEFKSETDVLRFSVGIHLMIE